jgi:hypothetical protein
MPVRRRYKTMRMNERYFVENATDYMQVDVVEYYLYMLLGYNVVKTRGLRPRTGLERI